MTSLRIAILTHSTNPRGGVAHCLSLAEALCELGHEAVVHAPDPEDRGFFRKARCPMVSIAAKPFAGSTLGLVRTRINDYLRHFGSEAACDFDVFHAHDGIGGNALATLRRRRMIPGFVRTIHHIDSFADPEIARLQQRSIVEASHLLCVSETWADMVEKETGTRPAVVGNGVDRSLYNPVQSEADERLRARWGIGSGPILLAVGGFEARKNTAIIIEAFAGLRERHETAQLVIVGGASLLDHAGYRSLCRGVLAEHGLAVGPGCSVVATGPVGQDEMPAFYRIADLLAFPSVKEGFGLCVLEAMACGTPTLVSRIAPFTEYLTEADTIFVDPQDAGDVARGLAQALTQQRRETLRPAGFALAARHTWHACAERHREPYAASAPRETLQPEPIHA